PRTERHFERPTFAQELAPVGSTECPLWSAREPAPGDGRLCTDSRRTGVLGHPKLGGPSTLLAPIRWGRGTAADLPLASPRPPRQHATVGGASPRLTRLAPHPPERWTASRPAHLFDDLEP